MSFSQWVKRGGMLGMLLLAFWASDAMASVQLTMLRSEFGPLHVARFHLHPEEILKEKATQAQQANVFNGAAKISGYLVKFYRTDPYLEIGSFPLFDTDQSNAFALYLPAGRIPFGVGTYRYRLLAVFNDGSRMDLGSFDYSIKRMLLKGVSPLRIECDVRI